MIISNSHKFIFIHNPKTGGSSLSNEFQPYGYRFSGQHEKIQNYSRLLLKESYRIGLFRKHIPARDLKKKVPQKIWDSHYKFGIVRNPYDRVISFYNYMKQLPNKRKVSEFEGYGRIEDYLDDLTTKDLTQEPWHCQYYYFTDVNKQIIVDYLGRFESLEEDYESICKNIGLPDSPLKHMNKSRRERNIHKVLSPDSIEKINRIFQDDFEIFNYEMTNISAPKK